MQYRNEITGLRAVAVIPLILFHSNLAPFYGGYIGVDVFFVISGYLITNTIINEVENKSFSIAVFHANRFRRIFPVLILVTIFSIFSSFFFMYPYQIIDFSNSILFVSTLTSNFYFWQNTGGYFSGSFVEQMPLLHTWSIAAQEQFYIFYPLLFIFIWRFGYKLFFFILLLTTILSLSLAEFASINNPRPNFFLIVTRVWEILLGSLASIYLLKINNKNRPSEAFSILGILLILIPIFLYKKSTPYPSLYALIPTIGTLLLIIYCNNKTLIGSILSSRSLVFTGVLSYGAFLWHFPLLAFLKIYLDNNLNYILSIIICIASFTLGYFSWKFIEIPFKKKNVINNKYFYSIILLSFLFIFSYSVIAKKSDGFSWIWPEEDREIVTMHPLNSAQYVREKFNYHKNKQFLENKKKNILIIGDSQAQDFVNLIYESEYNSKFNISTRHITPRCGNLNIELNLIKELKKYKKENCFKETYYDEILKKKIEKSDYIFLVSAWEFDEIKYINKSIQNIQKITNAKIYVVGRKIFPNINWSTSRLISIDKNSRPSTKLKVDKKHMINQKLMKSLFNENNNFINLHDLICQKDICPVFDLNSNLLSYDGSHFTKKGAKYVSKLLVKEGIFQKIFN